MRGARGCGFDPTRSASSERARRCRGSTSLLTYDPPVSDFYCDEALSGRTAIVRLFETANVLAFHHTKPAYETHIVVVPKQHIPSFLETAGCDALLLELLDVVRRMATTVVERHGACRVVTNLGRYQDSKHLHWHVIGGSASVVGT